jgi:hypothetical protein
MRRLTAGLAALGLALAACSPDSKHDILSKAEDARTKAELEAALGAPDDRDKMGPLETWTYHASDGEVTFVITGDTVRLQTATDRVESD